MMELRVEHLCKRYGENAVLDDISFTARVGVTRLLGPSGIGKTTLLRVLLRLETPDSGTVNGDKFRWTAVFQENRLLPVLPKSVLPGDGLHLQSCCLRSPALRLK